MRNIATELQEVRFILLNKDESPFTDKEYNLLEDLVDDVPYEKISKGDAGDVHKIQVGRFIRDEKIPVDLHESAIELRATCKNINPFGDKYFLITTNHLA